MPAKQHLVRLDAAQRAELTQEISAGTTPARQLTRARILLKADAGAAGPRWSDARIAEAVETSARTVARVRAAFVDGGLARAVTRQRPRVTTPFRLDAAAETRLVALACSAPPAGRGSWSLRLLADHLVELEIVDGISPETVRATLKKTTSSRG